MKKISYTALYLGLFLIFVLFSLPVFAQQVGKQNNVHVQSFTQGKEEPHVITEIQYEFKGHILKAALEGKLNLENGTRHFDSEGDFLSYVKNKTEALGNIRTLEESSTIEFIKTYNAETGQYEVIITVHAHAGFTILLLPYFKYSSNSGLLLSARGRDKNFLGSLERLVVDIDYTYDEEGKHEGRLNTSFQYPLKLGKKNLFKVGVDESISYRSDNRFYNKTSLFTKHSYSINSIISWDTTLSQDFTSETDTDTSDKKIFSFGKSTITSGPSILLTPTPLPVIANITYNPRFSTSFEYSLTPQDPQPHKRYDVTPSISQSLMFGQVNEVKNFRQGIGFDITNENSYSQKTETWHNSLSSEIKLHGTFGNVFGVDARIYGVQNFYTYLNPKEKDDEDSGSNVGDRLRGVLDKDFEHAFNALAINMTFLVKLFTLTPFAEFHLGVFSDLGVRSRINEPFEFKDDFKATVGIEVLTFPLFARAYILRVSYGIDLTRAIRENKLDFSNREIFIGLSRYF